MREPSILSGDSFNWEEVQEIQERIVDEDGDVNWGAAFFSDPGVTCCPLCGEYYWAEGEIVQCLECDTVWEI